MFGERKVRGGDIMSVYPKRQTCPICDGKGWDRVRIFGRPGLPDNTSEVQRCPQCNTPEADTEGCFVSRYEPEVDECWPSDEFFNNPRFNN